MTYVLIARARRCRRGLTYMIVGTGNLAVDFAVFNALLLAGVGPVTSKAVSTSASVACAFFASRRWTFADRLRGSCPGRDAAVFAGLNAVGLAIALAFLGTSRYVLGLSGAVADNVSANVLGTGAAAVFLFWSYGRFVFRAGPCPLAAAALVPFPRDPIGAPVRARELVSR